MKVLLRGLTHWSKLASAFMTQAVEDRDKVLSNCFCVHSKRNRFKTQTYFAIHQESPTAAAKITALEQTVEELKNQIGQEKEKRLALQVMAIRRRRKNGPLPCMFS